MPASALPSLLRNLTSTSRSTATLSLDSPSSSTLSSDDSHSIASSSRNKAQRRRRVVSGPAGRARKESPTLTSRPRAASHERPVLPKTLSETSQADTVGDETENSSVGRSRASSDSSLEGLTARLHGARKGRGSGKIANEGEMGVNDEGKMDGRGATERNSPTEPWKQTSIPTISLSTEEVESNHGTTNIVTPDLKETPPPLTTSSPFASPRLSTHSSPIIDSDPPPAIKINNDLDEINEEANNAQGQETTAISSSHSLSDLSDNDSSSSASSDNDEDDDSNLVSRSESHPDPREMLRAQLAKAGSGTRGDAEEVEKEVERRVAMNRTVSGMSARSGINATGGDEKKKAERIENRCERRRYFILSTAGKLVYTSDSDEDMASGLVGVMQAIVSIFADEGDKIRCVDVGDARITFLLKSPLYLVVSSTWGEPESVLRTHLDYLYLQVLSVVTLTQLQSIFSRRSNFDLRRMMEGTEPFFHSLVRSLQTSIPILTSSIEVYRIDPTVRMDIAKALDPGREVARKLDLLYVLLLARGRLVTLLRPKKHSIHPTDLHLLLSTVYSSSPRSRNKVDNIEEPVSNRYHDEEEDSEDQRTSPLTEPGLESWLPICLPRFNAKGFLHAYVSFLPSTSPHPDTTPSASEGGGGGVGLILLSSDREAFSGVKEAAEGIKERLLSSSTGDVSAKGKNRKGGKAAGGLVHEIEKVRSVQEYSLGELAIPGLRHFVYKSRSLVQTTRPAWEGDYIPLSARYRLITLYQHLSDVLHPRPAQSGTPARKPAQVQYLRTEHEAVLGWSTPQFELYIAASPFLPHSAVVSAAKGVSRWVEKGEQRLFLTNPPSFS
ncbi:hypothetical protein JCM5353_004230 [Sporobolomyces roseus]